MFAGWIVRNVLLLGVEVFGISHAMFVMAGVPYLSRALFADSEGIATLHELYASRCALVDRRGGQYMNVIGHDSETVELEFSRVAIAEERGDEKIGVCCALEMAAALVGEDCDRIGTQLLANGGHT